MESIQEPPHIKYTVQRSYLKSINILAIPILMLLVGIFFIEDMFVGCDLFTRIIFAFWLFSAASGVFGTAKLPESLDVYTDGSIKITDQIKRKQTFQFADIQEITNKNGLITIRTSNFKINLYGEYEHLTKFILETKAKSTDIQTSGV